MNWNPNITGIPCGSMVARAVQTKDGVRHYDEFQRDEVILASKCGKVIKSYWIPDEKRFAGFSKGEEPIAWMPWPRHPGITDPSPVASKALHREYSEFNRLMGREE